MFIPPKKSLGQHFLNSKTAIDLTVEAANISSQDIILEVGPGKGVLTEGLLACAREVIAVEKDDRLIMHLAFKFKQELESGKLKLIAGDILEFDPGNQNLRPGGYKIVANIPYYITGAFLRRFLGTVTAPSLMVLMLQKEVARRIVSRDEKESILSISVKTYGKPHYIETVGKEQFSPRPKVDSALLLVDHISKHAFEKVDEESFFAVLKTGFAKKRKKLISNLSEQYPRELVKTVFQKEGLDENVRAEDLKLEQWKALALLVGKERFQGA